MTRRSPAPPPLRRRRRTGSVAHSACQAPAARSCSWPMHASIVATRPGARRAAATAAMAATGLRLCGIVDEPPRPSPASCASPTSVCASSTTSNPALPHAPAATPSAPARVASRVRSVCHGSTGACSPSRRANAAATAGPSSPSAANVPAAPPSWAARAPSASRRDAPAASSAAIQPAALRPNVTGTACCSSVRPAIGVVRCSRASAAARSPARPRSATIDGSVRRAISTSAVSIRSWLVAPRWTWAAAAGDRRAVSARTSGIAGLPASREAAARAAGS